jgi:hypothetical protein
MLVSSKKTCVIISFRFYQIESFIQKLSKTFFLWQINSHLNKAIEKTHKKLRVFLSLFIEE